MMIPLTCQSCFLFYHKVSVSSNVCVKLNNKFLTILYKMCSVKFLLKDGDKTKLNKNDIDNVKNIISEEQI